MKSGSPETGTVIRVEGEQAVVRMQGEGACEKCGVAAAGMCTGVLTQTLTARNTEHARPGDTVRIGLSRLAQFTGFALAYVIPSLALFIGSAGGILSAPLPASRRWTSLPVSSRWSQVRSSPSSG